jgi:hypothetical protein
MSRFKVELSEREAMHILAALRFWQKAIQQPETGPKSEPGQTFGLPHFENTNPLDAYQIDTLCLKINFADPAKRQR